MEKSIKIVLIIIGILSISAGIYSYFYKSATPVEYFAIFIGVALIGSALFTKTKNRNEN